MNKPKRIDRKFIGQKDMRPFSCLSVQSPILALQRVNLQMVFMVIC